MLTDRHSAIILTILSKRALNIRGLIAQIDRHYWHEFETIRGRISQVLDSLIETGYVQFEQDPKYDFPNYEITSQGQVHLETLKSALP
jgi:DNA-binding PadR family transcriptional regulator